MADEGIKFKGDVSLEKQKTIARYTNKVLNKADFGASTGKRIVTKEIAIFKRPEDNKTQARAVCEIIVDKDMLNIGNTLHGGCITYMIDICSSIALEALGVAVGGHGGFVSQALNTVFHAPAPLGAKLEIINTTTAYGGRIVSARTEIWDATNKRLVASGVHNKMIPSQPKL